MATAGEDVIMIDEMEDLVLEDGEQLVFECSDVYEAYANVVGTASASAEACQLAAEDALKRGDANALIDASVNIRLCMAEFQGAASMMEALGLNPAIKLNVEVAKNAEG